eukprot:5510192-Pleurochrysis_carterae.AAC.1
MNTSVSMLRPRLVAFGSALRRPAWCSLVREFLTQPSLTPSACCPSHASPDARLLPERHPSPSA